jgi:two-component system response regulator AtoC
MERLRRYSWPGNIRELENTIERAMILCDGPTIDVHIFEDKSNHTAQLSEPDDLSGLPEGLSIKKNTRLIEERLIRKALEETGGNRTNAAKLLEISHRALLYKIREYGI